MGSVFLVKQGMTQVAIYIYIAYRINIIEFCPDNVSDPEAEPLCNFENKENISR